MRINTITALPICTLLLLMPLQTVAQHRDANPAVTMALTGDTLITRPLSVYDEPEYLEMIGILRDADVAFTNLEMLFHDFEPYPMAVSGGTWTRADPTIAKDLVWAGFDMVARANNHTGDYGVEGMMITSRHVADAGLVQAGVGMSLAEAREARFMATASARVALISVSSTFARHMAAGRSRDNVKARPGLNPLRFSTTYVLPPESFEGMRQIGESLGLFTDQDGQPDGTDEDKPGQIELFRSWFAPGQVASIRTQVNQRDVEEIGAVVNNASRLADYVIVTIHAHEYLGRREIPAGFLPDFARAMIDAGADVFVGHGPHVLRGIEMYKGKPIMYSLGDFVFQNETLLRLPSENYERYRLDELAHVADFNDARYERDTTGFPANREIWEGVIAMPRFDGDTMTELRIYPLDLGFGKPPQVRGRPLLAKGELADKILGDLKDRSAPFGVDVDIRRGVGYVKLAQ